MPWPWWINIPPRPASSRAEPWISSRPDWIRPKPPLKRIEALQRNRVFLAAYATAREAWLQGATVTFPLGTYWPRRFANVPIAEA